jgi:MSHA biogenesis protein MshP
MKMPLPIRAPRGFAIVTAIFLLVILAALGVGMLVFSKAQQTTSAYDVQGSRAYQAARAGIEWALYRRLNPFNNPQLYPNDPGTNIPTYCQRSSTTVPPPGAILQTGSAMTYVNVPASDASDNLALGGQTLAQFTVTITCNVTETVPDPNNLDSSGNAVVIVVRQITSTACNQPSGGACPNASHSLDYVQRKVQVTVWDNK